MFQYNVSGLVMLGTITYGKDCMEHFGESQNFHKSFHENLAG